MRVVSSVAHSECDDSSNLFHDFETHKQTLELVISRISLNMSSELTLGHGCQDTGRPQLLAQGVNIAEDRGSSQDLVRISTLYIQIVKAMNDN